MILYSILFPSMSVCNEAELYFKGENFIYNKEFICMKKNAKLSASTYFNSFSVYKWKTYTKVKEIFINLQLSGSFIVKLKAMRLENGTIIHETINEFSVESKSKQTFKFEYDNPFVQNAVLYWELTSLQAEAFFYGGYYSTNVDSDLINRVKLAIGICTFKREEFIIANLKRLQSAIKNESSSMFQKVKIFVADNGQTLPLEWNNDILKIVYNKNLGGAGGFTRCLIEASNTQAEENFTNFIFLDDDIILSVAAIERNIAFLALLKENYKKSVIGGAMFSTDERFLQFENSAEWRQSGFIFNMRDVDMRENVNIIKNEQVTSSNYNAWCYCCIPFDIINSINLPIPIFFHMDDVEYGLRNKLPVITLNGINVWHLYKKSLINAKNDYYDIRNKLIMLSEIQPDTVRMMLHAYLDSFTMEALKYHYARAINAFNGILDFCKGFDYFKNLDTIKNHKNLFNNVSWEEMKPLDIEGARISTKDERGRRFKLLATKTMILPANGKKAIFNENSVTDAMGTKEVSVLNVKENKKIIYKKSYKLAFVCFIKWLQIHLAIKNNLDNAIKEYGNRITEVQNIQFWSRYLGVPYSGKAKRVLFVASDNSFTSGAFRSMVKLIVLLKTIYKLDVSVILPKSGDGIELLKENNILYTIIESEDWIVSINKDKEERSLKKKLIRIKNRKAIKEIKNYLIQNKIDLVHINTSYSYVAALAAKAVNVPFVWHIREFLEEDQNREMIKKNYAYKLMSTATVNVAISDSILEKYKKLLKFKSLVRIYNGIEINEFYNDTKTIFNNSKIVFINVGVLDFYKGQHLLIEACGKLKRNGFDNFEVWLVGNTAGTYINKIEELIIRYLLNDNVKILGKRKDLKELYAKADISCVCSRAEAFGRITVEAMLSGCLVIGANTAGTSEIINDKKDGLLFQSEDSESLYEKILYAINNIDEMRQLARQGQQTALEKFSARRNAEDIYNLYCKIWEN